MCRVLRELAHYDSSHGPVILHALTSTGDVGLPGQTQLDAVIRAGAKKIAAEELILVTTGGSGWLDGSGVLTKVEDGFRFTARKVFGSGSPAGDLLLTMGVYEDPDLKPTVMHLPSICTTTA